MRQILQQPELACKSDLADQFESLLQQTVIRLGTCQEILEYRVVIHVSVTNAEYRLLIFLKHGGEFVQVVLVELRQALFQREQLFLDLIHLPDESVHLDDLAVIIIYGKHRMGG
ncbi:hypothetical protein D9M68_862810 [compost metagenome]